ncbi:glycine zipper 2TM domain-containing protein [Acidovorax sp. RAC01]|uniref:glycine zipper 2TM domain-containing protein n=1 Tax=Acidovorax sp. RAC01 TaxID=1842533 RepID=UPI00083E8807|nr:glycine zipper 2TM domain-containing protein [Acidovorax sp. RAC01]AOG21534.1 glycine zipper 2TM domain protein [Acidovorax sp. RAC01]
MSLTVPHASSPAAHGLPATASSAQPAYGPPLKWMWAAIGGLGVSVVALGAALAWQARAPGVDTAAAPAATATLAPAQRTPDSEIITEGRAAAPAARAPGNSRAAAAPAGYAAPSGGPYSAGAPGQAAPAMRDGGGQPLRTADNRAAPLCATCGRVESVQAVQQAAPATGVGAVAGGVLGAVVGNQIGKGSGRTAATVLGAVGGGYAGHKIEERTRTQTTYQVAIRMEDGSVRRFQRAQPPAVGTPVVLQGNGFRVADEGYAAPQQPAPGGYATAAQPGYVATRQ